MGHYWSSLRWNQRGTMMKNELLRHFRTFTRKRLLVFAFVMLAVALILLPLLRRPASSESIPLFATVTRAPLVINVRASGEIQSLNPNKIIPKLRRAANISFMVPEGTRVTNGQLVVQFNPEDLERDIQRVEASCDDALSRREIAKAELEIQRMDNLSALRKAEQDVENAEMELEKFLNGDEPTELRNAEIKVQNAEGEYLRKTTRFEQYEELLTQGFVTETEVQDARLGMQTALVAHETALIEQNLLSDYTHTLKLNSLEASLQRANTEMEKAQVQATSRLRAKERSLTLAEVTLSRANEDLARLQRDLSCLNVTATYDSVVNYGDPDRYWRRGEIQVGRTFYPGQVLMSLPDTSEMLAVVNIAEVDVHRVATGLTTLVKVEAARGMVFTGEVIKVAEVANNDGPLQDDVRLFKTQILMPKNIDLKPGYSCDAEILCEKTAPTLLLPVHAVFSEAGKMFVYPLNAGDNEKTEVKTGKASVHYVEILEGLREKDQVRLSPPESRAH